MAIIHVNIRCHPPVNPRRRRTHRAMRAPATGRALFAAEKMSAGKGRCFVVGCSTEHVSLHVLPGTENRSAWLDFIFDGDVPAMLPKKVVVCANHFRKESFENYQQYAAGFAKRLRLKEGSVPAVRHQSADDGDASTSPTTREVGCQTETAPIQKRTVGTQLSQRTLQPNFRSKGVQATWSAEHIGIGIGVGMATVPFSPPPPIVTSAPIKTPDLVEDMEIDLEGSGSTVAPQRLDPTHDAADSVAALSVSADVLYITTTPMHVEKKPIVNKTGIMKLFKECPVCKHPCTVQTRRLGTFISVVQKCLHCEYSRTWKSRPLLGNAPARNLHLSAAAYLSGASFITIQKIFRATHLQTFLYDTFCRRARMCGEPAQSQDDLLLHLSRENAITGGDIRADSPGHSAKCGSYTVMDLKTNTVINIQLVQSNEEGGSSHMEEEGLKRSLAFLKELKVNLDCIVTVQHPQIQKFLRGIDQYYNTWRMEKDVQQMLVVKEEFPPEEQNCSLDQQDQKTPDIKEEQEEADITDFTFSSVPVKDEDDEEEPLSSELHHNQTEENRDSLGPEPDQCLETDPEDNPSDLSETDVSDGNWEENSEPQSALNRNNKAPVGDTRSERSRKIYSCTECGEKFSHNLYLLRHKIIHTREKPFSCSVCKAAFTRKHSLVQHARSHTGEKPFSCSLCGQTFCRKNSLTSHLRRHSKSPYCCSFCNKTFQCKINLLKHKTTHTAERHYSCPVCGQSFSRKYGLNCHMRLHTGEKPFICSICHTAFKWKQSLVQHTRTHTGERPYSCSICGQSFICKYGLTSHMRLHTGETPFSCSVCHAAFKWKHSLTKHARTHQEEKHFSCSVCKATFERWQDFVEHKRIHTDIQQLFVTKEEQNRSPRPDQEPPGFKQQEEETVTESSSVPLKSTELQPCLNSYKNVPVGNTRRRRSKKIHSCTQCGKTFNRKIDLFRHNRIHTGDKPFNCSVCGQGFGQKSNVTRHMTRHTRGKSFSCCICKATFKWKDSLVRHRRTHAGEEPLSYNTS
ncbi:uncharacterized protein LOC108243916 isoform X2 [Kryptolebias marmoratus]|uniref:uncharacterized protein LOC108243916 isoform X2 n=1 Tax=Kryptolebias marmoratus TaxID=37003 RepID=UPI0018ACE460|nr:uncharacterized protein LOC108243916 isoform X2 [Kryptolebias marmoratus]